MDGYLHVHYVHCPRHHLLQNTQFALLLPRKFRKKQERETGLRDRYHHATDYLSTSPNTKSMVPITATASANMWPLEI